MVMEYAPICDDGVFNNLTEFGEAYWTIFVLLSLNLGRLSVIHSRIPPLQEHNWPLQE